MFQGLSNFAQLLRNAQQLGGKMTEFQERLREERISGSAGGGLIEAEVNGMGEVIRVRIDPQLIERGEREMIEMLTPAAINDALGKAKQTQIEAFQSMAAGSDGGLAAMMQRLLGGNEETS